MAMTPWSAAALQAMPAAEAFLALQSTPAADALLALQATPAADALLAWQAPAADAASSSDVNLLLISVFAFLAVFMVLATLALLMVALTRLFPAPLPDDDDGPDAAVIAAITAAASVAYPGMRVARVEESR